MIEVHLRNYTNLFIAETTKPSSSLQSACPARWRNRESEHNSGSFSYRYVPESWQRFQWSRRWRVSRIC